MLEAYCAAKGWRSQTIRDLGSVRKGSDLSYMFGAPDVYLRSSFASQQRYWNGLGVVVKLPLFWSAVAGLSLRLLGVQLPFKLDEAIIQMGKAAIPVLLIILGLQLSITSLKLGIQEFLATSVRLAIAPLGVAQKQLASQRIIKEEDNSSILHENFLEQDSNSQSLDR